MKAVNYLWLITLAVLVGITPAFAESTTDVGNQSGSQSQNEGNYSQSNQNQTDQSGRRNQDQSFRQLGQDQSKNIQNQRNNQSQNNQQYGQRQENQPQGRNYQPQGQNYQGQSQNNQGQNYQSQNQQGESQGQQVPPAGYGVVTRVDQPENCLRLRKGPSSSTEQVGCAGLNQRLPLTGNWSSDGRWAQMSNGNWVFGGQIQTDLKPPRTAQASSGGSRRGGDSQEYEVYEPDNYITHYDGGGGNWTDTGVVYGGPFWGGPSIGIGFGYGRGYGRHHGFHGGGGRHGGFHGGGGHRGGGHRGGGGGRGR